jgi:signal transduction histidine kinase
MDSKETAIYTAVIIICFIVGLIVTFFIISIIKQQRKNIALHKQNILAEITAMENERTRIAKDLHDDMGPYLSYIKFQVNSVDSATEEDTTLLNDACDRLDEAVQKLREIAANMMPSALVHKGLIIAIEELVSKTNQFAPIQLQFKHAIQTEPDRQISINIYRMLQEVVQNTIKHAEAKQMLIDIKQEDGRWTMLCEDNGRGFDYDKTIAQAKGLGLLNLKSRTELMNGKIFVQSRIGKGTQYIFELPITS